MATLNTTFGCRADILGSMAATARPANADSNLAELDRRLPDAESMLKEFKLDGVDIEACLDVFPEQKQSFADITALNSGLVLLTGGPGSGKVGHSQLLKLKSPSY